MKQRAKLAMCVVSAAVLAGAWLAAEYLEREAEQAAAVMESTEEENLSLAIGPREALTALSWSWDGQTVNLGRDAETGRWTDADDPACPLDAGAVEALARAASSTEASMAVEHVTELAQYGLAEPQLTVIAATAEEIVTYEVGNMSITGEYYVRRGGEDTVYLENGSLASFRVGMQDLLARETIPEDIAAVTGLSVRSDAGNYELSFRSEKGEEGWYRTDDDAFAALDGERVQPLLDTLLSADLSRCVGWTEEDAAAHGLDRPQMTATVDYTDSAGGAASFTMRFGDYEGDGVYAAFAGSDRVYLTAALVPDTLMYPDWDRLTPATVLTLETTDIASIDLSVGGQEYEILRLEEQTERSVGEGDGTVAVTDVIYSDNGWVIDTPRMEKWLASLADLVAEEISPAGAGRETLLAVTLTWKDVESVPAEVELRSYDSSHCLCTVGGDRRMLVSRPAAEAVIAAAEELMAR